MMKRNIILLFLLPALLIAGCENPMDDHGPEAGGPTTFTATIEGGDATKTTLGPLSGGIRPVHWSDGDAISISGATYTVNSGAGTTTATFTGSGASQTGGVYKAYYPASIYSGGTPSLPAVQNYDDDRIDNLPMYAESATTTLQFYNLCAVLEFKLTGSETVGSIGLKSTEGKKLSGAFTPQNWASDSRSVVMSASASDSVTLSCGATGVQLSSTEKSFFVAVPAQDYSLGTLKVTVKKPNGDEITSFTNSAGNLNALRSKIYDISKSAKTGVFSVTFDETSENTTFDAATKTITLTGALTFTSLYSLDFSVETNLGFTVAVEGGGSSTGTASPSNGSESSSPTTTPVRASIHGYGGVSDATSSAPTLTNYQPFSVGGGKQIYFSPGNLQYQASSGTWRFAQHQWDFVGGLGNDVGTVYEGEVRSHNMTSYAYVNNVCLRSQYTGWIDLFGWGTTGINYRNFQPYPSYLVQPGGQPAPDEYQPWTAATGNGANYGPLSGDLSGDSDWGVNMGNGYRTPAPEELEYIMDRANTNPDNCCYMHAWFFRGGRTFKITFTAKEDPSYTEQFTVIQLSYPIFMVILFPDGISKTSSLVSAHSSHINNNQVRKELTLEQLLELQNAGCVILPGTGRRSGSGSLLDTRYSISYSTNKAGTNPSSTVVANLALKSTYQFNRNGSDRYYGRPVRLVKDVTP